MNYKLIYLLLIITTLCSCKKSYKYVEKMERESILGGIETNQREEEIKADSDSSAYVEAFKKFSISQKVSEQMKNANIRYTSFPKSFNIYDDKGNDITNISFLSRKKREIEITKLLAESKTTISNSEKTANSKVDSSKIKELSKHFLKIKDEFSTDEKICYKPKSAPKYSNQNGVYCYFQTINNIPGNLRFSIQYYSDEWLFIEKLQFSIDGHSYEYIPNEIDRDSGKGGHIWEWFDDSISNSDKTLIKALANAKNAKIKFVGRQYYETKTMTKNQIEEIRKTIELYNAMGGSF